MAWSWSHSPEAYTNLYNNLQRESVETLATCLAEWKTNEWDAVNLDADSGFDNGTYEAFLADAMKLTPDVLADAVYRKSEEQATCDNGGFNAWICPYGCHMKSFGEE